ncbi:MAG: calcineurin-like phosphoesterase family protein [candidate division KSB1 bacterium]|nr:calcineurin-like phosphoesterase family protein [candidate division KSB1 bacterium]
MRRLRVTFFIFFISMINYVFLSCSWSREVRGRVFEDANQNFKFDAGERGIPGVLVSNQLEVVRTDENGNYRLPISDEAIIFITKPAGYMAPLNQQNLPQFYYVHQPKGSPDQQFKYKGVAPTGRFPASLDFPLIRVAKKDTFEVIVFADPQPRNYQEIDYIRDDVVAELIGTSAQFGITLGDIVFDDLSLYGRYNQIVSQIGIPFYNVPGNHDENYDATDDRFALETFKRHFGPNYYSFDYGQVHFIILDDVEYLGRNEQGYSRYQGKIGPKQLAWLSNDLRLVPDDRLIVLAMHIPLYTVYGPDASINVVDREALFEVLKGRERVLVLAGHMHALEHNFFDRQFGWSGTTPIHQIVCVAVCGTWWTGMKDVRGIPIADQRDGAPNGYHILTFEGPNYHERFKAASQPADFQLRVSSPVGTLKLFNLSSDSIIVNVFNGSERSVVVARIDNSQEVELRRQFRVDPFYEKIYLAMKKELPQWISPERSTHLWIGALPTQLAVGPHTLVVSATDQFGQRYSTVQIFEIE